jgi:hypothetical protein
MCVHVCMYVCVYIYIYTYARKFLIRETFSIIFPSTFCSKSVHAADNNLMSLELLALYSTLHHVSNTVMIITILKLYRIEVAYVFQKLGATSKL